MGPEEKKPYILRAKLAKKRKATATPTGSFEPKKVAKKDTPEKANGKGKTKPKKEEIKYSAQQKKTELKKAKPTPKSKTKAKAKPKPVAKPKSVAKPKMISKPKTKTKPKQKAKPKLKFSELKVIIISIDLETTNQNKVESECQFFLKETVSGTY